MLDVHEEDGLQNLHPAGPRCVVDGDRRVDRRVVNRGERKAPAAINKRPGWRRARDADFAIGRDRRPTTRDGDQSIERGATRCGGENRHYSRLTSLCRRTGVQRIPLDRTGIDRGKAAV